MNRLIEKKQGRICVVVLSRNIPLSESKYVNRVTQRSTFKQSTNHATGHDLNFVCHVSFEHCLPHII